MNQRADADELGLVCKGWARGGRAAAHTCSKEGVVDSRQREGLPASDHASEGADHRAHRNDCHDDIDSHQPPLLPGGQLVAVGRDVHEGWEQDLSGAEGRTSAKGTE